jgi:23S rRNA (uracil1939-C5)-methyltransferase
MNVRIDSIGAGGAGVARLPDGRVVFVQRTAPGDRATVELVREKKRWAVGRLVQLLEPGPGRRAPPCPHYAHCGGCTLEHLVYPGQLEIKTQIVREALRRIGRVDIETLPITASPVEFRYRNRVSFTLVRRAHGGVTAGFHDIDHPDRLVDISDACLLPEPAIARAWGQLRTEWGPNAAYLPSGERLRLTLRGTLQGVIGLVIDGGFSRGQPERLLARVPALNAIWQRAQGASAFRLLGGEARTQDHWCDEDAAVRGPAFLQVNRAAAELLEDHVLARARSGALDTVVDAYCGMGRISRRLAPHAARVTGIELDAGAIEQARRQAAPNAHFIAGRVEDELRALLPADLVIVNPPRSGLDRQVSSQLVEHTPGRILYVSCDPATLARDLAILRERYTLAHAHCFDLFPQTSHVETVLELTCVTS